MADHTADTRLQYAKTHTQHNLCVLFMLFMQEARSTLKPPKTPYRRLRKDVGTLFMLRVLFYAICAALLYENTGGVTACSSHLEVATYEAPRLLSSNGHAGRLVTTEQPWAESMKAYPGMTVARRRTAR